MATRKILGIILLALGILALVYGGFTYTKEEHAVDIGPVEIGVEEKETVNVPLWAGVVAAVAGVALIAVPGKS